MYRSRLLEKYPSGIPVMTRGKEQILYFLKVIEHPVIQEVRPTCDIMSCVWNTVIRSILTREIENLNIYLLYIVTLVYNGILYYAAFLLHFYSLLQLKQIVPKNEYEHRIGQSNH